MKRPATAQPVFDFVRGPSPAWWEQEPAPAPEPPSNGTATSDHAAEVLSRDKMRDDHRAILTALASAPAGLTDEAILQATKINPNALRARRGELVTRGMAVDTGQTRQTASGRAAIVWAITLAGREKL